MATVDQGDAAVWAAAIGVAGTLTGALGGGLVGALTARKQARAQAQEQGRVALGHWLREQRQAAYAALLASADELFVRVSKLKSRRGAGLLNRVSRYRSDFLAAGQAITVMRRTAAQVAVVGPPEISELAGHLLHWGMHALGEADVGNEADYSEAARTFNQGQDEFIARAQAVLTTGPA